MRALANRRVAAAVAVLLLIAGCVHHRNAQIGLRASDPETNVSGYSEITGNLRRCPDSRADGFCSVREAPIVNIPVHVEATSYLRLHKFLDQNERPPSDAIHIEELINAFAYDQQRGSERPVYVSIDAAAAPWQPTRRLVRIRINGRNARMEEQLHGAPIVVAKDVRVNVEFNPAQVAGYRLIGFDEAMDPSNDIRIGRDLIAGQTVTALVEVFPFASNPDLLESDPLRVQLPQTPVAWIATIPEERLKEMLNVRIRYKDPEGPESKVIDVPLVDRGQTFARASSDFRFAASVAAFGLILRDSPFKGSASLESVVAIARNSRGPDRTGQREEFVRLVERARKVWRGSPR